MSRQGTQIYVEFDDFEYKGNAESYDYEVPFGVVCEGIRKYFDMYDVLIDGTDNHVWNVISSLEAFSVIEDSPEFVEYCKETCREDAYEEFLEDKRYFDDEE